MSSKPYPHVLIIGAGLSGLTLAQILRKNNVSYEIFDRDESRDARAQGWAIALHGSVLRDLRASMPADIGPIEQTNHLTPLDHLPAQFMFYNTAVPGMRVGVNDDESGQIVRANRQRFRDWLRSEIPVQYDSHMVRVEEVGGKVTVHFKNGKSATGDILVGAEGSRSNVRKHILHGQDVMKPLPIGSLVGEIELEGRDFEQQLELGHSAYIVLTELENRCSIFAALNRVSDDGKKGYFYFILHWLDRAAAESSEQNPYWTVTASKEELMAFAKRQVVTVPERLRVLVDRVPLEGYRKPGIVLQSVELNEELLPAGRVMVIGDAAHSMSPCKLLSLALTRTPLTELNTVVRGEAGINALQDGLNLGRALTKAQETQATGDDLIKILAAFRDEMLPRAAKSIKLSNPVLEAHAADPNYKFVTCGKEVAPMAEEHISI
ncbi:putative monooxygenase [Coniella lustricola]|uniref:Putative monooxygenase n=1 Tax=Coniella lustricola TaxID=2025994 RepID=A0A2T2ZZ27_9PEZI|nr:putative monooxygenase [Coniella lustricola]